MDEIKRRPGRPRKETGLGKETVTSKETVSARRLSGSKETVSSRRLSGPKKTAAARLREELLAQRENADALQSCPASDSGEVTVTQQVTPRKRRVGNPALTGDAITATPSENAMYIEQSLRLFNLPTIDLHDPDAVQSRINEYFDIVNEYGMKPTVAGLGLALNGMDRQTLWELRTGNYRNGTVPYNLPPAVTDLIKKTYKLMENMWEGYMQNGKINPVSGIFLGKNNYGYQDKTEYVLTPNQPSASDLTERQLLERYGISDDSSGDSDPGTD